LRVEPALSVESTQETLNSLSGASLSKFAIRASALPPTSRSSFRGISAGRWHHQSQIQAWLVNQPRNRPTWRRNSAYSHPSQGSTFTLYPPQESRAGEMRMYIQILFLNNYPLPPCLSYPTSFFRTPLLRLPMTGAQSSPASRCFDCGG